MDLVTVHCCTGPSVGEDSYKKDKLMKTKIGAEVDTNPFRL